MKYIAIILIIALSSCVEPPRVMIETETGIIMAVKRPSYELTQDTVLLQHWKSVKGEIVHIAGNYKGVLPEADTTQHVIKTYSWGVVLD